MRGGSLQACFLFFSSFFFFFLFFFFLPFFFSFFSFSFSSHNSRPHPSRPHPSGPTLQGPTLRGPTFSGFGPHPFDLPTRAPPRVEGPKDPLTRGPLTGIARGGGEGGAGPANALEPQFWVVWRTTLASVQRDTNNNSWIDTHMSRTE